MVDFVLLSGRLISVFVEDVAGYIEKKQEARCRQQCGKRLKSQLKLTVDSLTLFGGLMTVLGFTNKCIKLVNTACKDIKKRRQWNFYLKMLYSNERKAGAGRCIPAMMSLLVLAYSSSCFLVWMAFSLSMS